MAREHDQSDIEDELVDDDEDGDGGWPRDWKTRLYPGGRTRAEHYALTALDLWRECGLDLKWRRVGLHWRDEIARQRSRSKTRKRMDKRRRPKA